MKSLAKNSIYNILYRCLNVVFPLITVSYVSHILQAKGIGEVSSATNIANYFTILAALGLPTYGTKIIAACLNKQETSKAFWELFIVNLISTFFFTSAYYLMIINHPFFQDDLVLYYIVGLAIVFNFINVDWFYQGKEEYGFIALRSLVVKTLSLIAIFIFVRTSNDILSYALILTLSNVANYVFNIIHIRKYISFDKQHLSIPRHLKPILILLLASFITELYTMFGITILTIFSTPESVGYYTNSMSVIRIIRTLVTAVCTVFLPRLSYYYSTGDQQAFEKLISRGLGLLIYLTVPAAIGICMVSRDTVIVLFGESFLKSSVSIQILSLSIITIALSNFTGYQIFITIGKERLMVISTIIGASINIILNILLIFKFDFIGIAISSSLSELFVTLFQIIMLNKLKLLKISRGIIKSVCISSLVMIVPIIISYQFHFIPIVELIIAIILGGSTYFAMSYFQKDEIMSMLINKMREFKVSRM